MKFYSIFLALTFSTCLMADQVSADEFVPLDPRIRAEMNRRGLSYENLQLTEGEQADFLLWFNVGYQPRSAVEAYIRDIERERARANGSGRTLRQIVGSGEEPTLSARDERRVRRALRRPGVPQVDYDSLTYEEKRRLIVIDATTANRADFVRAVRTLLANR